MKSTNNLVEKLETILATLPEERRHLILFLHRVQQEIGYVPEEALSRAADYFAVSPAEVYGLVTFYSAFRLKPGCRHQVTVCQGTACHVRGAPELTAEFSRLLGVRPDQDDPERDVALRTVNCLGCCALAPVVVVDGEYQGQVQTDRVPEIVKKLIGNK
ncbi:MAG: NAD(P)H-dependent oxidoreductase subunit E [Candidatus Saccharicenans sp.]|nr:NAD(P)H-dependent oxidoreductase subunit E [Candidatus Saccharicenans sp.]